ncbi:hypothetical protein CF386_10590 [Paraphotobacterium marinum]|uniref:Uncharacterized protein n=1 Tax=Paraphotobacterium marinum TaxID=1755811 RepID=A0A220VGP3_9GAMM|nr:hypothetical protein [Paraphotobacterium marinum]ASK79499.1 hypothetical protein CF386_10590 [Paraphotobacterium marinum]
MRYLFFFFIFIYVSNEAAALRLFNKVKPVKQSLNNSQPNLYLKTESSFEGQYLSIKNNENVHNSNFLNHYSLVEIMTLKGLSKRCNQSLTSKDLGFYQIKKSLFDTISFSTLFTHILHNHSYIEKRL